MFILIQSPLSVPPSLLVTPLSPRPLHRPHPAVIARVHLSVFPLLFLLLLSLIVIFIVLILPQLLNAPATSYDEGGSILN